MACSHSDLTVWGGYDFVANSSTYCGTDGSHGTKAAGVIAALDNRSDVVGVAPGAKIYSLRVCDTEGYCDKNEIVDALNWSGLYGMQVVSLSIAGCGNQTVNDFDSVVDELWNDGVPVVVAHGSNQQCDPDDIESEYSWSLHTISVAGHEQNGSYLDVFQYGPHVDFSAPAGVTSLNVAGGLTSFCCVSSAVPHVAGAFALLIEAGFDGVADMKQRLAETALDAGTAGKDDYYGYGLLRIANAAVPAPTISNLSWCTEGGIETAGDCSMTATTSNGAGTVSVRFVAYFSNSPSDSTVYDWGSATRNIYVPAGDYTLAIKTRARDAHNRLSPIVNTWEIPVCTGQSLTANCGGGEEN